MGDVHQVEGDVVNKKPRTSDLIPWRLIAGVAGGLLIVGLLAWGGSKFLRNLSIATPASTTLAATQAPATQPAATEAMTVTEAPTSAATEAPTQAATEAPTTAALHIGSIMTGKDGMTLLYVPAGEFSMGSDTGILGSEDEKPVHTVYLDAFWIDRTDITNATYSKCVRDGRGDLTDAYIPGAMMRQIIVC